MVTHTQIWTAIDRLAAGAGLSLPGLAKRAGLNATTFNKSKRITPDGRAHWPSTEQVAKSLAATGVTFAQFATLTSGVARPWAPVIPLLGFAQAGCGSYFDEDGFPAGAGQDQIALPGVEDMHIYALEIAGDSMIPAYRAGAIIVVSPRAPVRRGDRIVVGTRAGEVIAKELKRKTARTLTLKSLNPQHPDRTFSAQDVQWVSRIIWASQQRETTSACVGMDESRNRAVHVPDLILARHHPVTAALRFRGSPVPTSPIPEQGQKVPIISAQIEMLRYQGRMGAPAHPHRNRVPFGISTRPPKAAVPPSAAHRGSGLQRNFAGP